MLQAWPLPSSRGPDLADDRGRLICRSVGGGFARGRVVLAHEVCGLAVEAGLAAGILLGCRVGLINESSRSFGIRLRHLGMLYIAASIIFCAKAIRSIHS